MRKWIARLRPSRSVAGKLAWAGCLVGVATLAFYWGRHGGLAAAQATPPPQTGTPAQQGGYSQRVVGYIYKNIPVSREELGEYLIARMGAERIDYLINQKIIQKACAERRIHITDAEVNAQFKEDLAMFGGKGPPITEKDFVDKILKRYNKTVYEYKEDIIRPKLALTRIVKDFKEVVPTEDDIRKGFEAKYGEMVECRWIIWGKELQSKKFDLYQKVIKSETAFDEEAKHQAHPALAAKAGFAPPIHRFFEDPTIEDVAFKLEPGTCSALIEPKNSGGEFLVLKCVRKIPAQGKRLEDHRTELYREIYNQKVTNRIPTFFAQLRAEAAPQNFLKSYVDSDVIQTMGFSQQAGTIQGK